MDCKSGKGCCGEVTHSRIVLEEEKSKMTFVNKDNQNVTKLKIDGCQITDNNTLKCDYMLIHNVTEYYIELKGTDYKHGLDQIKATINLLSSDKRSKPKECFVICTRSPRFDISLQTAKRRFKKDFSANLEIKSSPFETSLS